MHRSRALIQRAARRTLSTDASKQSKPKSLESVYPYKLLHHHKHPNLFPYPPPGSLSYTLHHISSSFKAVASLCASQESRDQFLALTQQPSDDDEKSSDHSDEHHGFNGTIINTSILGQSDMGFMKVLTLFQDLTNDPVLVEYTEEYTLEDVRGFMKGCGWALENFHLAKDELLEKMLTETSTGADEESDDKMDDEDVVTAELDETKSSPRTTISINGQEMQLKSSNYDFLETAMNDPDSIEHTILSMTTPEMLEMIRMEGIMKLIMGNIVGGGAGADGNSLPPLAIMRNKSDLDQLKEFYTSSHNVTPIKEDTKVMNVALLSARVQEIYPGEEELSEEIRRTREHGQSQDPNAPLEDDSFIENHNFDSSYAQVVTQLEVLYELQQSSMNDDGKKHTQTSVMVGKFEACLKGDPNGDGLRWRLCSYRPAVEFGYFNTW